MIFDSRLIFLSSLYSLTKVDVSNPHSKKSDCDCDPKNVLHETLQNRIHRLPRTFLSTPPPDEADGRSILVFTQDVLSVRKKRWLVREVTPPFVPHQKAVRQFVIERNCVFFQSLR